MNEHHEAFSATGPAPSGLPALQALLNQALEAGERLGKAAAAAVLHAEETDRKLRKMQGAFAMASESRELWKQRAEAARWVPGRKMSGTDPLPHQAVRGDDVDRWLKRRREECRRPDGSWYVVDNLLDDYREHADLGSPLDADVQHHEED